MKIYTHDQVVSLLKKKQGNLTLRQFAPKIGCDFREISCFYNGRPPCKEILRFLGLAREIEKRFTYFELNGAKR